MKKEKILPREQYEKKRERKKDFFALLIGIGIIAICGLVFWVIRGERKESFAVSHSGVILNKEREYVGNCVVEIKGEWVYGGRFSKKIRKYTYSAAVKDSDKKDLMFDTGIIRVDTASGVNNNQHILALSYFDVEEQRNNLLGTMNELDNFKKVILRYDDCDYIVVAPAANAEEAAAVLEYENQKLLEQFNK